MSQSQSSLALEVKEELEPEFDLFIREKHLSIMDAIAEQAKPVIKVSGSITVSF